MNDRRGIFAAILARIYGAVTQPWSYPATDLIWVRTLSGLCFFIRGMCTRTKQAQPEREDREMKVDFSRHYSRPSSLLSTLLRYSLFWHTLFPFFHDPPSLPALPSLTVENHFLHFSSFADEMNDICSNPFFVRLHSASIWLEMYYLIHNLVLCSQSQSMYISQYGSLHLWINIINMGI